jgi:hypothetical protein
MGSRATAPRSAAAALLAAALLAPAAASAAADSLAARATMPRAPAGWETLATGLPEEARLRFRPGFRYDRVDGATPAIGVAFQSERDPDPFLYATASYATGRDRFLGEAGFEAPIGDPTWLRAGADLYRRTATEDAWIVGEIENTLFALAARTDYRDWYEATGWDGRATLEPGRDVALEGSIRIQNESSLPTRVRFSLFGKDDRFRPNPPVLTGDEGLLSVSLRVGPGRIPPRGGTHGTAAYERAGGLLGRDFDYGRARAAVRTVHRFSRRVMARARVLGGSTREGTLPPQKVWHVGGIGTLRGHDYKAFSGDQFFVTNTECLVRVRKNFFPFAFADWGAAWFGSGNTGRQRPGFDGGVGFKVGEDALTLTLARDLRRSDAPLRFGLRLGGGF